VLRQALLYFQPDEVDLAAFQAVVPDLAGPLNPRQAKAGPQRAQVKQQELSQATVRLLSQLARPVMIILEDLQWAGSESIALLQEVAPGLADQPLLLAGTFRDDSPDWLRDQLQPAATMHLDRLSGEDIATLCESMLGNAGRDPMVVELLRRETEGNAFFLVETVRALAEGAGQLDKIGVTRPPQFIMPLGMQAILQRRLSRVPKDARPTMRLASVAGRVLDLALLRAMEPEVDFEGWLMVCTEASVLEAYGDTWRFSHDKLREAIQKSLPHDLHHELHRRVAEAMESLYPDPNEYAAALAHHWFVAGDRDKELHYTVIAAEQAVSNNAHEEAKALLARAAELRLAQTQAAGGHHPNTI